MADYSGGMNAMAQALAGPGNPSPTDVDYLTPQGAWQQRAMAQQLLQMDPSATKGGWASALAGLLSGVNAGRMMNQTTQQQKQGILAKQNAFQQGYEGLDNSYGGGSQVSGGYGAPGGGAQEDAAYFTKAGLSPVAAAGLAGGFQAESGNNPNVSKVGDGRDGSPSFGKGQWNGPRAQNLIAYARAHGASPNDPNIQRQFPLVEMGLAGSPSDPGYGTERQAGAMLASAKTPQDATVAALQYERPGGWKPGNPMGAYSAQKRLAYTTALLGGQGAGGAVGQPGSQGASGMPIQMAQNMPQRGFGAANAAAILANPNTTDTERASVLGMMGPQVIGGPGEQQNIIRTGGPNPNPKSVVTGATSTPLATPDMTLSGVTTFGPQGPQGTQFALPGQGWVPNSPNGAAPSGGGSSTMPNASGPIPPSAVNVADQAQRMHAHRQELDAATAALNGYKTDAIDASNKLALVDGFKQLGQTIESGWGTQQLAWLASKGIPLVGDSVQDRVQAYQELARRIGLSGDINPLNLSKGARASIANSWEAQLQYKKQLGDIAQDEGQGDQIQRFKKISQQKPPNFLEMDQGGGDAGGGKGGGGGTSNVNAASPPVNIGNDEAAYKALPKGKKYIAGDGKVRTKQ